MNQNEKALNASRIFLNGGPTLGAGSHFRIKTVKLYTFLALILMIGFCLSAAKGENSVCIDGTITKTYFQEGDSNKVRFQSTKTEFSLVARGSAYSVEAIVQTDTSAQYFYVCSDGVDIFEAERQLNYSEQQVRWTPGKCLGVFSKGSFPTNWDEPAIQALIVALHPRPFSLIENKYHAFPILGVMNNGGDYDFTSLTQQIKTNHDGSLIELTFIAPQVVKSRKTIGDTWLQPDAYKNGYEAGKITVERNDVKLARAIYYRGLPKNIVENPSGPSDTFAFFKVEYEVKNISSKNIDPLSKSDRLGLCEIVVNDQRGLIAGRDGYVLKAGDPIPFRGNASLESLQRNEQIYVHKKQSVVTRGVVVFFLLGSFATIVAIAAKNKQHNQNK